MLTTTLSIFVFLQTAGAPRPADAVADAREAVAAWISRKDAPVGAPLLEESLRMLDEAARREGEIPVRIYVCARLVIRLVFTSRVLASLTPLSFLSLWFLFVQKADSSVASGAASKGSGGPGGAFDLLAAAGELIDAIIELGRDGALGREAVEAKLRVIVDQLAAASSVRPRCNFSSSPSLRPLQLTSTSRLPSVTLVLFLAPSRATTPPPPAFEAPWPPPSRT